MLLLPTPRNQDGYDRSNWKTVERANRGEKDLTLTRLMRYRGSTGESSPPPSDAGRKPSTAPRLSPSFVEWMMGAPEGWTDPDCPLSATEFSSRPDGSPGDI